MRLEMETQFVGIIQTVVVFRRRLGTESRAAVRRRAGLVPLSARQTEGVRGRRGHLRQCARRRGAAAERRRPIMKTSQPAF